MWEQRAEAEGGGMKESRSTREFLYPDVSVALQVCTGLALNGFLNIVRPFLLGLPGPCVNGALMLEDVGVCQWVCGRLA